MYYYGTDGDYNIMAIDLLGPTMEDLLKKMDDHKFTLPTVLMFAGQAIERLCYVHSKSLIHRDIKPENFLIGIKSKVNEIFLIDFGLARRYRDSKTKIHIPYRENKSLTGTARYASINTHLGIEQSRRDDLECLSYVLLYLIRGSLPWQGLKGILPKEKQAAIMEKKMEYSSEMLSSGYGKCFSQFLDYTKNLKFEDKPDYDYSINLFSKALFMLSKDINLFDWQITKRDSTHRSDEEIIADEFENENNVKSLPLQSYINNERHFNKYKKKPIVYNLMCAGLDMEKVSKMLIGHANITEGNNPKVHKMLTVNISKRDDSESQNIVNGSDF